MLQQIANIEFSDEFTASPDGRGPIGALALGSRNILSSGLYHKAFLGLQFAGAGSRVMMQAKATFAGLDDLVSGTSGTGSITSGLNVLTTAAPFFASGDNGKAIQLIGSSPDGVDQIGVLHFVNSTTVTLYTVFPTTPMNAGATFVGTLAFVMGTRVNGSGALFTHIANTLFFQGAGQAVLTGAKVTGAIASSTLQLLLSRNGSYTATDSGPYSAGLSQPSAPQVFVKTVPGTGFSGLLDSPALALKIAAIRATTGAKSIASPSSVVFACSKQTVVAVVPTMQSGGTDWVFFATQKGFGGIGPYQRLPVNNALQVPETYFERTITDVVTNSTHTITSAAANFTALDVGKKIVLSVGGSLTTTIQSITDEATAVLTAPATWSSSGNHANIIATVAIDNSRTITDGVTNNTTTFTSATAKFTQADVGKQIVLSGGSVATVFTGTIASVTNATTALLSANPGTIATAVTATIVDVFGVERAIELEWQDGDLTDEFAWIDDYPPPAGTHCAALNNVVLVGGCFSDATSDPSSTSAGTCIAVSLQNFPESFRPTDLLYLPGPLVDFKGRPSDSYLLAWCRDSVHQVQYVGGADGPACILTTLWPDVGIANPHAWCQSYGIIFAAIARGGLVTIGANGQPDSSFAAPVKEAMKDWDPAFTIVQWHPETELVVASNLGRAYAFSLQSGGWSAELKYSDFVSGNALSATQSQNTMRLTMESSGARTLYNFNQGSGSYITALSHWVSGEMPGRPHTIWEIAERIESDSLLPVYVSIHRNFRKAFDENGAIAVSTNVLSTTTANFFKASDVGSFVLVLNAGAAGAPLVARISSLVNGTTVNLCDATTVPISGAAVQNASATVSNAYFLIAKKIYSRTPWTVGSNLFRPKRRRIRSCFSFQIGITMKSTTGNAQALGAALFGILDQTSAGINK